jgi:hypothetical protein
LPHIVARQRLEKRGKRDFVPADTGLTRFEGTQRLVIDAYELAGNDGQTAVDSMMLLSSYRRLYSAPAAAEWPFCGANPRRGQRSRAPGPDELFFRQFIKVIDPRN